MVKTWINLFIEATGDKANKILGPLRDLNAGKVQDEVGTLKTNLAKVRSLLVDFPDLQKISKDILKAIADLKDPLRLLEVLCNKAMRTRHWTKVKKQNNTVSKEI